jgi:hypothetical protein
MYRPKYSVISPEVDVCRGARINTGALSAQRAVSDNQSEWVGRRKAQPADVLLPATRRWLDAMPDEYRPLELAKQFARLANLIASAWNNPRECSAFIHSLLRDQRGGRRGFPPEVMEDIVNLRVYYARFHPIVDWETGADADRHRQDRSPSAPKR